MQYCVISIDPSTARIKTVVPLNDLREAQLLALKFEELSTKNKIVLWDVENDKPFYEYEPGQIKSKFGTKEV